MTDHPFCPCCGYNFKPDETVTRGRWELGVNWTRLDGNDQPVTAQQSAILHTVATCPGVKMDAMLARVSDSCNENVVNTQLSRLRRLFGQMMPVKFMPGRGYQWIGDQ